MLRKLTALLAVVAAAVALAGCGSNDAEPKATTHTAANGDVFNAADVTFATNMIQHHAQALVMTDMSMGRPLGPKAAALIDDVRNTQAPEIETMVSWLNAWGKPIPATERDHAHGDQGGMDGMEMSEQQMPGMMSGDELKALDAASDTDFQQMWLTMMIAHHKGAIEMAQTEQDVGTYAPAIKLAQSIERSQQKQISQMEQLLGL